MSDSQRDRWTERIDLGLGISLVLWLQVVGLITRTVLHHVLHALPLLLLVLLPRTRFVRWLSALTSYAWIFMLAVVTPELRLALGEGEGFRAALAPVMAVLSAFWMALNLMLLSERIGGGWGCFLGSILLIPALMALNPYLMALFEIPLRRVLEGRAAWVGILVVELVLVLAIPWKLGLWLTGARDLRLTRRLLLQHAGFWAFFLACMIGGLAVDPL
jgi:hypothetical protein